MRCRGVRDASPCPISLLKSAVASVRKILAGKIVRNENAAILAKTAVNANPWLNRPAKLWLINGKLPRAIPKTKLAVWSKSELTVTTNKATFVCNDAKRVKTNAKNCVEEDRKST